MNPATIPRSATPMTIGTTIAPTGGPLGRSAASLQLSLESMKEREPVTLLAGPAVAAVVSDLFR